MQMGVEAVPLVTIREPENERRLTLLRDASEVRRDLGLAPARADNRSPITNPLTRPVRVGLYRGWTASMDEGWTRLVFDTFNVPYQAVRDRDVRAPGLRARYDVIILPDQSAKEIV